MLTELEMQESIVRNLQTKYERMVRAGFIGPNFPTVYSEVVVGSHGRADIVLTGLNNDGQLCVFVYELKRLTVGYKDLRQITNYMAAFRNWISEMTGIERESSELDGRVIGVLIGQSVDDEYFEYINKDVFFQSVIFPDGPQQPIFIDHSKTGLTYYKTTGVHSSLSSPVKTETNEAKGCSNQALVALNFKVSQEQKMEIKLWAANKGLTQRAVLEEGFRLLKEKYSSQAGDCEVAG